MPVSEKECMELLDKAIEAIEKHVKTEHDEFYDPTEKILKAVKDHADMIKDAVCKSKKQ